MNNFWTKYNIMSCVQKLAGVIQDYNIENSYKIGRNDQN